MSYYRTLCVQANSLEKVESLMNERINYLGPNFDILSIQCVTGMIPELGSDGFVLTALTKLGDKNRIGEWPVSKLRLSKKYRTKILAILKKFKISLVRN